VSANIAEGYGRDSKGSYVSFLKIAQGSLKQVEIHAILAQKLEFASVDAADRVLAHSEVVGKMFSRIDPNPSRRGGVNMAFSSGPDRRPSGGRA
jgi:four helix bundle protein